MDITKMKEYYKKGLWEKALVEKLVSLGKISEEEHKEITGELNA